MKIGTPMSAVIPIVLCAALAETASGVIEVSRGILKDTTWTSGDTIKVTRNVIVSASGRLTIQGGTVVLFNPGAGLFIQGQLKADGRKDERTLFTCTADTAAGKPTAGQWNGLNFLPGSTGTLRHCDIRFAGNGVHAERATVTFYGCAIEDFSSRGIYIDGSGSDPPIPTVIERCIIRQNDTTLKGSGVGILIYRSVDATISQCEVSDCQYGVQFRGNQANAPRFQVNNSTIRDHASYGIYIPAVG